MNHHQTSIAPSPLRIVVGSTNSAKIESVRRAFSSLEHFSGRSIEVEGIAVDTGVADQPFGDEETLQGAKNRVCEAKRKRPDADYWCAVEGGCFWQEWGLCVFSWGVVADKDNTKWARSGSFTLPQSIAERVKAGVELGYACDHVFGTTDVKRGLGVVGVLTHGAIDRIQYGAHVITLALIPFINPSLYPPPEEEAA
ncbi:unnamed protein product [Vitrella brassicaformis CCMP3155]|uniref:inosine/xanthosine triphosphatase n=1 Tax=Vitrella brassicaformis (strain CCMP3155) TaxID=1169540 RepID=A0A0G4ER61_VITBC|nr:unnamed protein product [Vitrella brassicaformis CCMP3155]|mmetsp:Transcript_40017/g.100128  ORF Transcript_40017/g.100128 Transcript_40017/m.100128 type:complete len:197 (-) Transcript_40017:403-993(-)|eukprot:CEM00212.1 unnamed protein product [Vitrella brassicaformis CCMP3155]